ncbi:zinc finger protein 888-like [Harmonia axyridis]|nr:zinc finger protein 888-like [Harmonia axyridis]
MEIAGYSVDKKSKTYLNDYVRDYKKEDTYENPNVKSEDLNYVEESTDGNQVYDRKYFFEKTEDNVSFSVSSAKNIEKNVPFSFATEIILEKIERNCESKNSNEIIYTKIVEAEQYKHNLFKFPPKQTKNMNTFINSKPYKCHFCDSAFRRNSHLKSHIDSVHSNSKQYKCHMCSFATNQKSNVKRHIDSVHLNTKQHKCYLCDYVDNQKSNIKTHIDTVHLNLKRHKCHLCDYASYKKRNVNIHIEAVHLNLKQFKCDLCDYASHRKNNLKVHVESVHLNLRQHKCVICKFATNHKYLLVRHVGTVHSNLKQESNYHDKKL